MSDNDKDPQDKGTEVKDPATGGKKDSPPESVPYDRFSKVIAERNDVTDRLNKLSAKLESLEQFQQTELDKDLERKGEYEILAGRYKKENDELKDKIDGVKVYESEQRTLLTARLPENKQEFAVSMSLIDLARFVDVEEKTKVTPREDPTPGERFGGYDNVVEFAKKDPDGYAKARKSGLLNKWRTFGKQAQSY